MDLNLNNGIRLKECLQERKMSQATLAKKSGFTQQYISNIVNGRKPMTVTAARSFAKILNILESYLLGESDFKTEQDRRDGFIRTISDINTCMLKLMSFNGITILRRVLVTDTGETLVSDTPKLYFVSEDHLLGTQIINDIEYTITKIQYDIKIYDKIYRVDASRINEMYNFINEYLQIQRSRLYSVCAKRKEYSEISE